MAFSFTDRTGDGITTSFTFGFTGPDIGYIRESDITVEVDGSLVSFTLTGDNSLELDTPPADQALVRIIRSMPLLEPYSDFTRGNPFGQRNINNSFRQSLYALHSVQDGFLPADHYYKDDVNFGENRAVNLSDPVDGTDAVTKNYGDAEYGGAAATEAQNWANYPEDALVPEGDQVDDYSALHHAIKASDSEDAALLAETGAVNAEVGALAAQAAAEAAADAISRVFDDVASMRANPDLVVGMYVRTKGYHSPGDGGSNLYEIVAPATGTPDGGSYIDLTVATGQAKGLFPTKIIYAQQFGTYGNEAIDSAPALRNAIAYIIRDRPTGGTNWNANPDSGEIVLDLCGLSYLVNTAVSFPTTGGGGFKIRGGRIVASATFDPARYLLEANTTIDWFTRVTLQDITLDGAFRGGCLRRQRASNWLVQNVRIIGFATDGDLLEDQCTSNVNVNCQYYERQTGDVDQNNPGAHTGTAIRSETTDLIVANCHFGHGLNGIKFSGGGNRVSHCHFYGSSGLAIEDTSQGGNNSYNFCYFDAPSKMSIATGYVSSITNCQFLPGASVPYMLRIKPQAGVDASNFICTSNIFVGTPYTVPGTAALTLSSAAKGTGVTCTSSEAYFDADMVGSTIRIGSDGNCVITGFTSTTVCTVRVLEPFSSTSVTAGTWEHVPTSIYVDESLANFGPNSFDMVITDNAFADCQAKRTSVTKSVTITSQENGEIEFGGCIVPYNGVKGGAFGAVEGNVAAMQNLKALYFSGSVAAFDFDVTYSGGLEVQIYTSRQST